jgi:hypothetical protein
MKDMAAIAVECARAPGRASVWAERHGRYFCEKHPRFAQAKSENTSRAPINATFKLVFLTSAGGTLLFVLICVVTTIAAGQNMPDPLYVLIRGIMDLAKIGFGAVVGLLGVQSMRRESGFSGRSTAQNGMMKGRLFAVGFWRLAAPFRITEKKKSRPDIDLRRYRFRSSPSGMGSRRAYCTIGDRHGSRGSASATQSVPTGGIHSVRRRRRSIRAEPGNANDGRCGMPAEPQPGLGEKKYVQV